MQKLSYKQSPTIKEVQAATGFTVPQLEEFFGLKRKSIYQYNRQNGGRLPRSRWFELQARMPEVFEK